MNRRACGEKRRQGGGNRGGDREMGVGDVIETIEGGIDELLGTGHHDPCKLELRLAEAFGETAEGAAEAVLDRGEGLSFPGPAIERVGEKDLGLRQ
jgi:hypothetical protein